MVKLCDFGSCSFGHTSLRDINERSNAKEIIDKETTPMYRAPEMIDLYLREELTEKTDIWVSLLLCIYAHMRVCIYMQCYAVGYIGSVCCPPIYIYYVSFLICIHIHPHTYSTLYISGSRVYLSDYLLPPTPFHGRRQSRYTELQARFSGQPTVSTVDT